MLLKERILSLCQNVGFLMKQPNMQKYSIAPTGAMLVENLKREWMQSMVNNKELTIYYSGCQNFHTSYDYARRVNADKLPFGFASCVTPSSMEDNVLETDRKAGLADYLMPEDIFNMNTTIFISPSEAIQLFHHWQRQRRMWWRKFSSTPGRYFTTDINVDELGKQTIEIRAKYSWGDEIVELLHFRQNHTQLTSEQLENYDNRSKVKSLMLESEINLGTMYLNTIFDAYEELKVKNGERHVLKFHRKLAPYKIGFSISNSFTGQLNADLKELAMYLCKKLRTNQITSLLLPTLAKVSLDSQFEYFDYIGVPYAIVLSETTLKDGILNLRSRDTTIKEQVHVNELTNYVDLLFRHY